MSARILCIDDVPSVLSALLLTLRAKGDFEAKGTTRAEEVVALAKEFGPHLILCDIMMTPKTGTEVAEELAADPITADIKVVFLTSLVEPTQIARQHGVVGGRRMISKLSTPDQIVERVRAELIAT